MRAAEKLAKAITTAADFERKSKGEPCVGFVRR